MLLQMLPAQEKGLKYALENPYSILAMGMRTGKSVVSCAMHEKLGGNTLVVAPAYLIDNWKFEIRKWLGPEPVVTAFQEGKAIYKPWDTDICLISYNLAMKAPHLFEWCDRLLLDEAHKLKSMDAKLTQFFHQQIYENSIDRVHPLSGTPIKNRVKEFWSLLAITNYDPRVETSEFLEKFPDEITFADYFSHRDEYVMEVRNRFVTVVQWRGLQRVEELKQWLAGRYIRIKTEEVITLNNRFEDVLISESADKRLLREFERYFAIEGNSSVGPAYKAEAALQKVPFTTQYVDDLLESKTCVPIYTDHTESARALAAHFNVTPLIGNIPPKKRMEHARAFQRGERRVLVASIKSLSEGVTLTRAKDLVLNDLPWVPGDLDQVVMRLQGVEKKSGVRTIHRIFGSPQDAYIAEALAEKMEVIRRAT